MAEADRERPRVVRGALKREAGALVGQGGHELVELLVGHAQTCCLLQRPVAERVELDDAGAIGADRGGTPPEVLPHVAALRAMGRWYQGATGRRGGKCRSVVAIQRLGSAVNLNLHYLVLHVDGVFDRGADSGAPEAMGAAASSFERGKSSVAIRKTEVESRKSKVAPG
jgi:hypothetical protein